jgi:D-arginine dehydrogenase
LTARALPRRADAVVVGAGLAGASVARALAARGLSVLVLEEERAPGLRASGKSAGILRRVVEDAAVAALARAGGAALEAPPPDLARAGPLLRRTGVLLTAGATRAPSLRAAAAAARAAGLLVEDLGPAAAVRRAPVLTGAPPAAAAWHAADGVVDVAALLGGMLAAAEARGAALACGCPLRAVVVRGGRVAAVETARGRVATGLLVDAAGARADAVAALAGLAPLGLVPARRHLFVTGPAAAAPLGSPVAWDTERGVYLRPEATGALASPCDEDPHAPREPRVVPSMRARLAEKLAASFPGFGRPTVRRAWAGLRTLAADGRFVLGPDPRLRGFAWAAALGGHGVSVAAALGDAVADLALEGRSGLATAAAMGPDRLAEGRARPPSPCGTMEP